MATSLVKEWLSSGIGCKRFFQLLALRTQNQHYTGDLQMWSACYREDVEVTLQQLSTTHEDHMHDHQEDVDDSSSDLLLLVCIWELLEGLYWTDAGSTKFIEWHVKYFATEHEPSQTISMDGLHHLTATFVCATIQYNMEVAYLCIQELHEKSKQLHHDTTRNYFIQERYEESIDMFCYWIKAAPAMQDGSTDAFLTWQQEAVHIADSFRELIDDEDTIKESPYAFLYAVWRVLQMVAGGEDALADLIECCSLDHLWWMAAYLSYFNHQTLRVDRFSFDAVLRCARTDFHKTSNARVHYFDRLYDLVETVTEGLPDSKDNTLSSQALSNVARVLDRMSHAQTTRRQNEMDFLTQWMRAHLFDAIVNPFGNQSISDVRRRDDAIQKYAQLLATAQPLMALKYLATAPTLDPSVLCAIVDNLEQINPMHGILTIQQIRTDMDAYLAPTSYHRISLKNYFGSSLPGKDCERWVRLVITHGAELLNEAFVHLLRRISEETSLPLFFMYCIEIKQRDSNCAAVDAHLFNRFASSSVRELSAIGAALQHHVYGETTEECARHFPLFVASWIHLSFLVYQALELHNHEALHQVLNSIQLTHTMAQDIMDHIDSNSVPQRTTAHVRRKLYELRCITQISPSSMDHKALH